MGRAECGSQPSPVIGLDVGSTGRYVGIPSSLAASSNVIALAGPRPSPSVPRTPPDIPGLEPTYDVPDDDSPPRRLRERSRTRPTCETRSRRDGVHVQSGPARHEVLMRVVRYPSAVLGIDQKGLTGCGGSDHSKRPAKRRSNLVSHPIKLVRRPPNRTRSPRLPGGRRSPSRRARLRHRATTRPLGRDSGRLRQRL